MRRILAMTLISLSSGGFAAAQVTPLFDFSDPEGRASWSAVNDDVMGGISEGGPRFEGDELIFEGRTRLENNGGFSSIRSDALPVALAGYDGLILELEGDGRGYRLSLQTSFRRMGFRYWCDLELPAGEPRTLLVPFEDFYPTAFGRRLPGPALDLDDVRALGFIVYDGEGAPFSLRVRSIGAFRGPDDIAEAPLKDASGADSSLLGRLRGDGRFTTLLRALEATGLDEALDADGRRTLLAPTDAAFSRLPEKALKRLLRAENRDALTRVLENHLLEGRRTARELLEDGEVRSLAGSDLGVDLVDGRIAIGDAALVANDLEAGNGLVQAIDSVLLPPLDTARAAPAGRLIAQAVQDGSRLFNEGQPAACAALYRLTAVALLTLDGAGLEREEKRLLREALEEASASASATDAAWALRRALDAVWTRL